MADIYKEVIRILEEEHNEELDYARKSEYLMKQTLNPIKRIRYKNLCKSFEDRSIGICVVICELKRKFGES